MAALWPGFQTALTGYLKEGTLAVPGAGSVEIDFPTFLIGAYLTATTPVAVNYSTGLTVQPVINGVKRIPDLILAVTLMLNANGKKSKKLPWIDFLPAALAFCKYWSPGIGVTMSPFPAPYPCFAPLLAGTFINDEDYDAAKKEAGLDNINPAFNKDLLSEIQKSAIVNDPVVIFPSPIVIFPGNPIQLAKDLHFAMTQSFTPEATASNLTFAFANHLSSIIGIYAGFKDPATPPTPLPIMFVVFKGLY
jgi:hypothetical protein